MIAALSARVCSTSWHLSVFVGHAVWSSQQVGPLSLTLLHHSVTLHFCSHVCWQLMGEVARGDWALSRAHDVCRHASFRDFHCFNSLAAAVRATLVQSRQSQQRCPVVQDMARPPRPFDALLWPVCASIRSCGFVFRRAFVVTWLWAGLQQSSPLDLSIMRNFVLEFNIESVAAFDHSHWQLRLLLASSTKFGLIVKNYLLQGATVVKQLQDGANDSAPDSESNHRLETRCTPANTMITCAAHTQGAVAHLYRAPASEAPQIVFRLSSSDLAY